MKRYTKEHEWVVVEGVETLIGITEHAAKELGDITYVELPKLKTDVIVGDVIGVVESVKAASDIFSPVSGTVSEINIDLEDDPGIINRSAEKDGWICKLDNIDIAELDDLMTPEQYQKFLKTCK